MAIKLLPPQSYLLQILRYDQDAGKLFWLPRDPDMFASGHNSKAQNAAIWNARYAGKEAFTTRLPHGHGYSTIQYKKVLAHRVIWKMVHGVDPSGEIDHINGCPWDNRLSNLRDVAHVENGRNMRRRKNNTSGHNGVCLDPRYGTWAASISVSGLTVHLGLFPDIDDAVAARKAAEVKYGFHENHGRSAA